LETGFALKGGGDRAFDLIPEFGYARANTFEARAMTDQNIFATVLNKVRSANTALVAAGMLPAGIDQSRVVVEPPRDADHGDMATNAAMVLANAAGKKPRELADAISDRLRADALIDKVEVAGPGFINLTLKPAAWVDALRTVLRAGRQYGQSSIGNGTKVNVEYVSANPTGPMHVGHCRGAVFGDALANLLIAAGYEVTREYYINDAGAQIEALSQTGFLRYREALGENIGEIPEGLYPGDYVKQVGEELKADYGKDLLKKPESEWKPIVRERAINIMMADIRNDLWSLGVVPDVFFSESSLTEEGDQVAGTIEFLRKQGYIFEGRLPPPKGAPVDDYEDREQTLFRATAFGDDVDRPLKKSDGSYTYFASDIAYHKNKLDRGFNQMIDVWGADHGGYVKRMQAAVKALSGNRKTDLDVKIVQLVKLMRDGQPVKMSKRAGEFVTLREVVEEVGRNAVRFMMLYRKNDAVLEFDLTKVIEQSRDNPVFYVQYGHARGRSVFRNVREFLPDLPEEPDTLVEALAKAPLDRLEDPGELSLMRRLALYPRLLEGAALAHEPHRIAFYLYELASDFHAQWNRGKDMPHLRFIMQNDREMTLARLALVQGVVTVLASGLATLGVDAPEEMR
jgi:arginyl-tRNA synthetase